MANQDIYKLVEELNKNKRKSDEAKIDDIYSLLDEVKKEEEGKVELKVEDTPVSNNSSSSLSDYKDKIKPCRKPDFPTEINKYEKRSDCFINILNACDYGENNAEYVKGHKDALDKYMRACNNNPKDLYVVEGQASDEYKIVRNADFSNKYNKGYYDGVDYVIKALDRSKLLVGRKINDKLIKELG